MTLLSPRHFTFRSASFGAAAASPCWRAGLRSIERAAADDEKKPTRAGASGDAAKADAGKNEESAADVLAIRKSASAFVAAFDRGIARHRVLWTAAGTLTDEEGTLYKEARVNRKAYAAFFKQNPGAKLSIRIESISSPAPGWPSRTGLPRWPCQGEARRPAATGIPCPEGRQVADGERPGIAARSPVERRTPAGTVVPRRRLDHFARRHHGPPSRSAGSPTASFLQQTSTVTRGIAISSGMHVIGWDPESDRFRSWAFDSTGGFGSGLWYPTEHGYHIDSRPDSCPTERRPRPTISWSGATITSSAGDPSIAMPATRGSRTWRRSSSTASPTSPATRRPKPPIPTPRATEHQERHGHAADVRQATRRRRNEPGLKPLRAGPALDDRLSHLKTLHGAAQKARNHETKYLIGLALVAGLAAATTNLTAADSAEAVGACGGARGGFGGGGAGFEGGAARGGFGGGDFGGWLRRRGGPGWGIRRRRLRGRGGARR